MYRKPTNLQRGCSYIWPLKMARVHSKLSGWLQVDLVKGRYQLSTGNAIYSYEDLYTSYGTALHQATLPTRGRALILGLGLGSIPYLLRAEHGFTGKITCVEIDPVVIKLAATYHPPPPHWKEVEVVEADAVSFVENIQAPFDIVTMDVFVGEEIPYSCWDASFLQHLKNCVAPGGTLMVSRLLARRMEEDIFWNNLATLFPNAVEVRTHGNMILIWKNDHKHSS